MDKYLALLGWKVRDKVTGFTGIVQTIGCDLYGCIQAIVTGPVYIDKDGAQKTDELHWYDVTRLEKQGDAPVMTRVMPREINPPGGYDKPTR